jgi:hypothetical protein
VYGESDGELECEPTGGVGGDGDLPKNMEMTFRTSQIGAFNRASRADSAEEMNGMMQWGVEANQRTDQQPDSSSTTSATPTVIFHDGNKITYARTKGEP